MKLIDLLVKKTNEEGWSWPGKSTFCYQTKPEHGSITKFLDRNGVKAVDYCWEKCDDASAFNELTKEQYDSALAASEGWIEWGGGNTPVDDDCIVDVKFRNGQVENAMPARYWEWGNQCHRRDIFAYRLHKPGIKSRANDDRLEQDLNECIGASEAQAHEWDGIGRPKVGSICQAFIFGNWSDVKIAYAGDEGGWNEALVFDVKSTKPAWADEFRPLRTEAEKKRDAMVNDMVETIFYYYGNPKGAEEYIGLANGIIEAIEIGKIPGVKLDK